MAALRPSDLKPFAPDGAERYAVRSLRSVRVAGSRQHTVSCAGAAQLALQLARFVLLANPTELANELWKLAVGAFIYRLTSDVSCLPLHRFLLITLWPLEPKT